MVAWEKDNTTAKNRQKIPILTMREQTLVSNVSIRIRTRRQKIWTSHVIRNTLVLSCKDRNYHSPVIASIKPCKFSYKMHFLYQVL